MTTYAAASEDPGPGRRAVRANPSRPDVAPSGRVSPAKLRQHVRGDPLEHRQLARIQRVVDPDVVDAQFDQAPDLSFEAVRRLVIPDLAAV